MTLDNGSINYDKFDIWEKICLGIGIFVYMNLLTYIVFIGLGKLEATNINPSIIWILIIAFVLVHIAGSLLIGKKLGVLELDFKWMNKRNIVFILVVVVIKLTLVKLLYVFTSRFGILPNFNETSLRIGEFNGVIDTVAKMTYIVIAAPIIEEIFFRGFIMKIAIEDKKYLAIFVSTIAFGILHYGNSWFTAVNACIGGFIYAISYYKTSRLEVPIMIHMLYNFLITIIGL